METRTESGGTTEPAPSTSAFSFAARGDAGTEMADQGYALSRLALSMTAEMDELLQLVTALTRLSDRS